MVRLKYRAKMANILALNYSGSEKDLGIRSN